ncbi:MAG: sodium-translocating pyrophosphatase [bacterium]
MLITWLATIAIIISLAYTVYLIYTLYREKVINHSAQVVADYIKKGARVFLMKQGGFLGISTLILATTISATPGLGWSATWPFIFGVILTAGTGILTVFISTTSTVKIIASHETNNLAKTTFTATSIIGSIIATIGLIGVGSIYLLSGTSLTYFCFALGASIVTLFVRVGGGAFTKAADISADLVGKLEENISEDDMRNPATVADAVGDNVGDLMGNSVNLLQDYMVALIATTILGGLLLPVLGSAATTLPLTIAATGIIIAVIGSASVRFLSKANANLAPITLVISTILMTVATYFIINATVKNIGVFLAIIIGLICGLLISLITKYYTSDNFKPTQKIIEASKDGSATNIISGLSLGFFSTIAPALLLSATLYFSYQFADFYGLAMSALGMLSILAINLAYSAFGPIIDNTGTIAQMSGMGQEIREKTDQLDIIGNSASAIGKGFVVTASTITTIALIIILSKNADLKTLNALDINAIVGFILGGLLPMAFAAITINSVLKTAEKMIKEIRRQFTANPEILSGNVEPDYNRCISLATNSALSRMLYPSVIAITSVILVGYFLGVNALVAMLIASAIMGFLLSIFMDNAGSAWDNAKKYLTAKDHSTGSAYSASIVGDVVGDPFKDTAGPALNILVQLMVIVALIILPLILR